MLIRHNKLHHITLQLLTKVCNDVILEPTLQTLTGENFTSSAAHVVHDAYLDISPRGFWTKHQMILFDVRIFDLNAKRYENKSLQQCFVINEKETKETLHRTMLQVKNESSNPLVFSVNGCMGTEATTYYGRIAGNLIQKRNEAYSVTMAWLRRKISFSCDRWKCEWEEVARFADVHRFTI